MCYLDHCKAGLFTSTITPYRVFSTQHPEWPFSPWILPMASHHTRGKIIALLTASRMLHGLASCLPSDLISCCSSSKERLCCSFLVAFALAVPSAQVLSRDTFMVLTTVHTYWVSQVQCETRGHWSWGHPMPGGGGDIKVEGWIPNGQENNIWWSGCSDETLLMESYRSCVAILWNQRISSC